MKPKQTAVEWFAGELSCYLGPSCGPELVQILEQAQAMEREQIEDAIQFGFIEDGDLQGVDYFYETRFNGGKNICPNCKQGILRLERPGKMGCSVC